MSYYITTSIPYANADPHIGHALELVQSDVLARYARQQGKEVIFSTGTDEHGTKIYEKALEKGVEPSALTDELSQKFRDLAEVVNSSHDRFIRTTDEDHETRAQKIWKALEKDIYKAQYKGLYCVGCEEYVTEATAKENNNECPAHQKPYEVLEEENYFFKLSKYSDDIKKAIEDDVFEVIPEHRKNEVLGMLKKGLEDISISRPADKLPWGVPVPDDKTHVMYVWFEALMNYITVLGYPEKADFKDFWPADMQVIGKDIFRFHTAIWPGILLALGIDLPKKLYIHGFIYIAGQKMSKSIGNVVSPSDVVEQYGTDALRYYLLSHIPSSSDGDFTWDKFHDAYTNELGNELGNAMQRTIAMIVKYKHGKLETLARSQHDEAKYHEAMEQCQFDRALEVVWKMIRGLNQYIETEKPWVVAKTGDSVQLEEILSHQAASLMQIADLLEPFLPSTATAIKQALAADPIVLPQHTLFPRIERESEQDEV